METEANRSQRARGRPQSYDWASLTDGRQWVLTRGEDYRVATRQLQATMLNKAHYMTNRLPPELVQLGWRICAMTKTLASGTKLSVRFFMLDAEGNESLPFTYQHGVGVHPSTNQDLVDEWSRQIMWFRNGCPTFETEDRALYLQHQQVAQAAMPKPLQPTVEAADFNQPEPQPRVDVGDLISRVTNPGRTVSDLLDEAAAQGIAVPTAMEDDEDAAGFDTTGFEPSVQAGVPWSTSRDDDAADFSG